MPEEYWFVSYIVIEMPDDYKTKRRKTYGHVLIDEHFVKWLTDNNSSYGTSEYRILFAYPISQKIYEEYQYNLV